MVLEHPVLGRATPLVEDRHGEHVDEEGGAEGVEVGEEAVVLEVLLVVGERHQLREGERDVDGHKDHGVKA